MRDPDGINFSFDIRTGLEAWGIEWRARVPRESLIRRDVETVISVDNLIWPSCTLAGVESYEESSWPGLSKSIADLMDGTSEARERRLATSRAALIRIVLVANQRFYANLSSWKAVFSSPRKLGVAQLIEAEDLGFSKTGWEWDLLGYDVADRWLISGLLNCGLASALPEEARADWAGAIGETHTFIDEANADRFCDLADSLVPEHAPFFVYALCVRRPHVYGDAAGSTA